MENKLYKCFVLALSLSLFSCTTAKKERDVRVIIAADLHFDLLPETDQYYHVVAMNQYKDIQAVIIAGDIFDKSRPEILSLYQKRYEPNGSGDAKNIHFPVYPGLGNHDIDPAVSDKGADNLKGRKRTLDYMDALLQAKLSKGELLNVHASSRSYSWNIGDVHFIQGQRYAGDTTYCASNYHWLENDLKKYAATGNPVVYIQHYGVDNWALTWWPQADRNRLFDLLDQYNLAAFFVGHTHEASIQWYRGYPIYQVNNAWKDGDGNGSFALLEIKGDSVSVKNCSVLNDKGAVKEIAPILKEKLPLEVNREVLYTAFSHNDYEQENPLLDAIAFRFNCVEADLWAIDGELYVSHDRPIPAAAITFSNLYLKPLIQRLSTNNGRVYMESNRPFYLMIDCKNDGEKVYNLLKKQLADYQDMFCAVENGLYVERPILLFLSGNQPTSITKEKNRFVFLDGKLSSIGKAVSPLLTPVVSDCFTDYFSWNGRGEMPKDQLEKMRQIIQSVHQEGKQMRWWGAKDTVTVSRLFIREGVDLVGADNLEDLANTLK